MWGGTAKWTKRDYLIGGGVAIATLLVLASMMYAMTRVINAWFPVGCTP